MGLTAVVDIALLLLEYAWCNSILLEYIGINSSYESLDQVELQMDSNNIYYFEFQTWNLDLQPA